MRRCGLRVAFPTPCPRRAWWPIVSVTAPSRLCPAFRMYPATTAPCPQRERRMSPLFPVTHTHSTPILIITTTMAATRHTSVTCQLMLPSHQRFHASAVTHQCQYRCQFRGHRQRFTAANAATPAVDACLLLCRSVVLGAQAHWLVTVAAITRRQTAGQQTRGPVILCTLTPMATAGRGLQVIPSTAVAGRAGGRARPLLNTTAARCKARTCSKRSVRCAWRHSSRRWRTVGTRATAR